jgi:hypothetical protein
MPIIEDHIAALVSRLTPSGPEDEQRVEKSLFDLQRLASPIGVIADTRYRDAIVKHGGVPALVELAASGVAVAAHKALACAMLATLAFESDEIKMAIVSAGGLPHLISLVASGTDEQQSNAAWALGTLAANDEIKPEIVSAGGLEPLFKLSLSNLPMPQAHAAAALDNLRHKDGEIDDATEEQLTRLRDRMRQALASGGSV